MSPGSPKGQPHLGRHEENYHQLVKGGDCPALFSSGVASLWRMITHPSLMQGYKVIRVYPEQSDQDGERPWEQDLQGAAEVPWLVQLRGEMAEGRAHSSPQLCLKQVWRGRCWSPLPGISVSLWASGMKLHWGKFSLDIRKSFFTEKVLGTRTVSLEK